VQDAGHRQNVVGAAGTGDPLRRRPRLQELPSNYASDSDSSFSEPVGFLFSGLP